MNACALVPSAGTPWRRWASRLDDAGEPGEVGGPRGGHGGLLVCAARAHLDEGATVGRARHPGRGRGDCGVVVEDRQGQRLQHDAFAEGAVNRQHRRAGEVQLALGVPVDVAAESVVREIVQGVGVEEVRKRFQRGVVERELRQRFHEARGSGDHAVPPTLGQPAGEHLERGAPMRGAVAQRRREHGQLVLVGQQRRSSHPATVTVPEPY